MMLDASSCTAATPAAAPATTTAPDRTHPLDQPTSIALDCHAIRNLKGCLSGRVPAPTRQDIQQAVAAAQARENQSARLPALRLPPLEPGEACSIKDLKGCLAGRRTGPHPTIEDMDEAMGREAWASYLRSLA